MRRFLLSFVLLVGAGFAQPANLPKGELLWPGGAPGAQGTEDIDKPTLAAYLVPAGRGTGTAVIVCPGGGYQGLSMDKEGDQIARWLNSLGVTSFVLKYRLGPKYHHPVELGRRAAGHPHGALQGGGVPHACRTASGSWGSRRADIWHRPRGRTSTRGTAGAADPIDRLSSRPDFLVLCYPVISFTNYRASGLAAQSARRKRRSQAGGEPVE